MLPHKCSGRVRGLARGLGGIMSDRQLCRYVEPDHRSWVVSNTEVTTMHSATQERRRKFYGWGYEGDEVSPQEIAEFEKAWTRLIGASDFTAVPFPTEDSINLRPSRVKVSASLEAICTTDKYDRLYHSYGASTLDVAYSYAANSRIPPTPSPIRAPKTISSSYSAGAKTIAWQRYRMAAAQVWPAVSTLRSMIATGAPSRSI
jgi:hypothetical protein